MNIFECGAGDDRKQDVKMSPWTLGKYDYIFDHFLTFCRSNFN